MKEHGARNPITDGFHVLGSVRKARQRVHRLRHPFQKRISAAGGTIPANLVILWTRYASLAQWLFYRVSLDAQRGTKPADYTSAKTYCDFTKIDSAFPLRTRSPGEAPNESILALVGTHDDHH